MTESKPRPTPERRYPPFWDKWVPVMVALIVMIIVGLVVVALSVLLGWFPGSA